MAEKVKASLEEIGEVTYGPFDDNLFPQVLSNCEILMVRLSRFIGKKILSNAPNLRYIICATTGLDHIDLMAAKEVGIRIICLRDCPELIQDVSSTAEHCWGLLLALVRFTTAATTHVLGDQWDRNQFWGRQLNSKRLGIIGYGRIGSMVGRYGAAFGMEVLAFDIDETKISTPSQITPLTELVQQSDIISVHVTADPENRHLIDRALISQFKQGAFFLNTARGMIVDNKALADAVVDGLLSGVAVDVLEGEETGNMEDNALLVCAKAGHNVLITPHIGGATVEAIAQAEGAIVMTLKRLLIVNDD